jgi:cytosine/adenosine deaminase-related metal-dependent hydrolase
MEGRLVLKNCAIFGAHGPLRTGMAVVVEAEKISRVAPNQDVPILPGDWEVGCRGRLVAPGLIDCHAHLVSGQIIPSTPEFLFQPPPARVELLNRIEADLSASEVEALTAFAIARALRRGTATIFEHLHCPSDVANGLARQASAADQLGVRFVNSHASSSLFGPSSAVAQLEANAAQAQLRRRDPRVRTALGFCASFCCDDDLLTRIGRARQELGVGVHYHLAETEEDRTLTLAKFGERILTRFESRGLLGAGSIAAHARAIAEQEAEQLGNSGAMVAVSPLSDWLAEPGSDWEVLLAHPTLLGLATIGSVSLWEELAGAIASLTRLARLGRLADPSESIARLALETGTEVCSFVFGERSGAVEAGALADLVVYDFVPEDSGAPLWPDPLLQLGASPVAWTIVAGQVLVREGRLLSGDYLELAKEADRSLHALWRRAGLFRASN